MTSRVFLALMAALSLACGQDDRDAVLLDGGDDYNQSIADAPQDLVAGDDRSPDVQAGDLAPGDRMEIEVPVASDGPPEAEVRRRPDPFDMRCGPPFGEYQRCESNSNCLPGLVCTGLPISGTCIRPCADDLDCPAPRGCLGRITGRASCGRQFLDGTPVPNCCEGMVPDLPNGLECNSLMKPCTSDADCISPLKCMEDFGWMDRRCNTTCQRNGDCPPGAFCAMGVCYLFD